MTGFIFIIGITLGFILGILVFRDVVISKNITITKYSKKYKIIAMDVKNETM